MAVHVRPQQQPAELMTLAEAATALRTSQKTILRLGREGRLNVIQLGERIRRVPVEDVDALINGADRT